MLVATQFQTVALKVKVRRDAGAATAKLLVLALAAGAVGLVWLASAELDRTATSEPCCVVIVLARRSSSRRRLRATSLPSSCTARCSASRSSPACPSRRRSSTSRPCRRRARDAGHKFLECLRERDGVVGRRDRPRLLDVSELLGRADGFPHRLRRPRSSMSNNGLVVPTVPIAAGSIGQSKDAARDRPVGQDGVDLLLRGDPLVARLRVGGRWCQGCDRCDRCSPQIAPSKYSVFLRLWRTN